MQFTSGGVLRHCRTLGARSAWHRHPAGQVLHVTEGAGLGL